jgi:hypothetical protein
MLYCFWVEFQRWHSWLHAEDGVGEVVGTGF